MLGKRSWDWGLDARVGFGVAWVECAAVPEF